MANLARRKAVHEAQQCPCRNPTPPQAITLGCVLDGVECVHGRLKGALNLLGFMGQREDAPTDVPITAMTLT